MRHGSLKWEETDVELKNCRAEMNEQELCWEAKTGEKDETIAALLKEIDTGEAKCERMIEAEMERGEV